MKDKNKTKKQHIKELKKMRQQIAESRISETERKKVKNELRMSREKYKTLTENINVGIYRNTVGPKGKFIEANPAIVKMFGYENKEELLAMNISDLYQNPDDRRKFNKKMLREGFVKEEELKLKKKDGIPFIGSVSAVAVKDGKGKVKYYDGIIEDITERKRIKKELWKKEQYKKIFEFSPEVIGIIDTKGNLLNVNKRLHDWVGYKPEEVIGKNFLKLPFLSDESKTIAMEKLFLSISGKEIPSYELGFIAKSGEKCIGRILSAPIKDENGKLIGELVMASDITERKRMEKALQESEERYRNLFENAKDVIVTFDLKGQVTSVNKAIEEYGFQKDELVGKSMFKLIAEKYWSRLLEGLEKITGGESVEGEIELSTPKGGKIIEYKANSIKEGETVVGIQTIMRNITKRKNMEKQLRKSEAKYRDLVENMNDIIYAVNKEGIIIYVSPSIKASIGYNPSEVIGHSFTEFIYWKDLPRTKKEFQSILSGRTETNEYRILTKSGEIRWIRTSSRPIIMENCVVGMHCVIGMQGVLGDITERKLAEKELRMSREKYKTLTENINVGIYRNTVGPKGKFIEANPAIVKMFGYENKEELLAMNISDLYQNPDDRRKFNKKMLREGFVKEEELKLKKKDGIPFIGSVSAVAVKDGKGKVKYYDGIIEDITERKEAKQIQSSLKEKETLLKEIHHRVKNNLQIISSLLNLQVKYFKDKRDAAIIKGSQDRIKSIALIHEELYKSKDLARIDFSAYIKNLINGLYSSYGVGAGKIVPKIEVKDISFGVDVAIPCGLIINELVSNSLKHAFPTSAAASVDKPRDEKGEIKIFLHSDKDLSAEALEKTNNKFTLIISDNGVGLPKDVDFRKTESLGMQLVNTLVKQIKGTIKLDRSNGTEFTIRFREFNYKKGS